MPSCQSAGTMPDLQSWINTEYKSRLTGPLAHFSTSGAIPSEPVARPLFNFLMAQITLLTVGSSVLTFGSGTAEMDSDSRDVEVVAGR